MSACEKCWRDAQGRSFNSPSKSTSEHYQEILLERKGNPCSEEEQRTGKAPRPSDGTEGKEKP